MGGSLDRLRRYPATGPKRRPSRGVSRGVTDAGTSDRAARAAPAPPARALHCTAWSAAAVAPVVNCQLTRSVSARPAWSFAVPAILRGVRGAGRERGGGDEGGGGVGDPRDRACHGCAVTRSDDGEGRRGRRVVHGLAEQGHDRRRGADPGRSGRRIARRDHGPVDGPEAPGDVGRERGTAQLLRGRSGTVAVYSASVPRRVSGAKIITCGPYQEKRPASRGPPPVRVSVNAPCVAAWSIGASKTSYTTVSGRTSTAPSAGETLRMDAARPVVNDQVRAAPRRAPSWLLAAAEIVAVLRVKGASEADGTKMGRRRRTSRRCPRRARRRSSARR